MKHPNPPNNLRTNNLINSNSNSNDNSNSSSSNNNNWTHMIFTKQWIQ